MLYKCDALKYNELNETILVSFPICECVRSFKTCLENINTEISNEFSLLYSINTTKCLSNEHPMIKCNKYEAIPSTDYLKISSFIEREKYFKRCSMYELDRNQQTQLQPFDVTFKEDTGMCD